MIHLENVYNVIQHTLNQYDQVWFITRDASEVQGFLDAHSQVILHAELSPQPDLFRQYRELAKAGKWDKTLFDSFYVPRFLHDLSTNQEGLVLLNELKTRGKEKDIALACFCEDESMCHRSIVGGILQNIGANISCPVQYKKYTLNQ